MAHFWSVDRLTVSALKGRTAIQSLKGLIALSPHIFEELSELLSISYNLVLNTRLLSIYDKILLLLLLLL